MYANTTSVHTRACTRACDCSLALHRSQLLSLQQRLHAETEALRSQLAEEVYVHLYVYLYVYLYV